jgi:hypothetical protein
LLLYEKDHLFSWKSVPCPSTVRFLWGRMKRQLIAKLCTTQKCCRWMSCTVIVFFSPPPLPDRITKQPTLPTFIFLSFLSMDFNLLWSHLQYPSGITMDFFSYKFFAEFPIRVDRLHNIAMRYAFCYYKPQRFSLK